MLLALLGGCGLLRLAYAQADAWAFRWLDGYVDFDDAQSLQVRDALGAWFAWNRKTQLADYAALLDRIEVAVAADTTQEQVCGGWDEVRRLIDRGLEQAVPAMAAVGATLQPAQIANVERRDAKANREFRDDHLQADPEKRRKAAVRRVVRRAESLYGDLDEAQRERIALQVGASPYDPQRALDERELRQRDVVRVLRRLGAGELDAAQAQGAVRALLSQVERSPRDAYRRYAERLVQHNCTMAASIHNATTPAQRRTASRKLKGWAAELRELARPSGA
ncbi:MAG: DUF6279 family lipoprotein [Caldimonas sp.]